MKKLKRSLLILLILASLFSTVAGAAVYAKEPSTRWADAADEIDKYLDAAFEYYLEGDAKAAYDSVSNAYFRVYETTGFERQTMSYVSGNRKNAVEMQFSTCKAAVKKDNTDLDTRIKVRSALVKLKSMIREDGNKLAAHRAQLPLCHGLQRGADPFRRARPAAARDFGPAAQQLHAAAEHGLPDRSSAGITHGAVSKAGEVVRQRFSL